MQWNPYLAFNGQCETAFKFYERCFGGQITSMVRYGDAPAAGEVPSNHRDKIMHARLVAGGQVLMGGDAHPGHSYEGVKGCSVTINVDNPDEADRLFNALAENATIQLPLQQTFWAKRFGMLTDQFGVPWMINC